MILWYSRESAWASGVVQEVLLVAARVVQLEGDRLGAGLRRHGVLGAPREHVDEAAVRAVGEESLTLRVELDRESGDRARGDHLGRAGGRGEHRGGEDTEGKEDSAHIPGNRRPAAPGEGRSLGRVTQSRVSEAACPTRRAPPRAARARRAATRARCPRPGRTRPRARAGARARAGPARRAPWRGPPAARACAGRRRAP